MFSRFFKSNNASANNQKQLNSLLSIYDSAQKKYDRINSQLYDTNLILTSLQNTKSLKQRSLDNKNLELMKKEQEIASYNQETVLTSQKLLTAQWQEDQLKESYNTLISQQNSLVAEQESLSDQITMLSNIRASSAPKPVYTLDGLYCMNNIYMCKNHPPREIISNQNEIDAYQRMIDDARGEARDIRARQATIQQALSENAEKFNSIANEYRAAQNVTKELQESMQANSQLLSEALNSKQAIQHEISSLEAELQDIDSQLSQAQSDISNYQQDLTATENDLNNLKSQIEQLQTRLASANESQEASTNQQLEELARAELRQENEGAAADKRSAFTQALYDLAQRELANGSQTANTSSDSSQETQSDTAASAGNIRNGWALVQDSARQARSFVGSILTTAGNLWPSAGSTLTEAVMQQAGEVANVPAESTGDLIVDYAAKQRSLRP